jgi:hypothetical protein
VWQGRLPKSFLQKIGLVRQRDLYSIGKPKLVTAGEMLVIIADYEEQFGEVQSTADLREELLGVAVIYLKLRNLALKRTVNSGAGRWFLQTSAAPLSAA